MHIFLTLLITVFSKLFSCNLYCSLLITLLPACVQSIAISLYVCLFVGLSVCLRCSKPHMRTSCTLSVTPACCFRHGMFYFAIWNSTIYGVYFSRCVLWECVCISWLCSQIQTNHCSGFCHKWYSISTYCTFVSFLYHIYLISLSSNGLIDVDLCHTYMMISYCLFAMLVVSHYLQVVCRNHNPSFLSVLVVF